jgi:hypothetical protein
MGAQSKPAMLSPHVAIAAGKVDGISPQGSTAQVAAVCRGYAAWINRDILALIPEPFGPAFGLFHFLDELGETVRNCLRSGGLVVFSPPPPDYGADLFP